MELKIDNQREFTFHTINYIKRISIAHRKSLGQYFTPKLVREKLIGLLPRTKNNPKILDPGCGTGEFLLTAKKYFKNPELEGWDIDGELIKVSKKNIPMANLKKQDTLLDMDCNKYDFVIGNPPYFEFIPSKEIRERYKEIINGRANIFSLFIYQGLRLLKNGGYLAYVVPPSMNNGAYFSNLRKFIVNNANIECLHILDNSKIFTDALQTTMLLVLKKTRNKGDYIFEKNGILIFSEDYEFLKEKLSDKITLHDLNYEVKTGRLVWSQNKKKLTNNSKDNVPLIWAHNITESGLNIPIFSEKKPQYVKTKDYNIGPAIVVNRITGSVKSARIKAAIIPPKMRFIAENHVNVIFPPYSNQRQMRFFLEKPRLKISLQEVARQLVLEEKIRIINNITGNTQISKTELEKLFPIN